MLILFHGALLLLLAPSNAVNTRGDSDGQCKHKLALDLDPRQHSVCITEFSAVGDGKTLNTVAFQNAIFYLKSFADNGGRQLYDPSYWDIVEPLPSYGRWIETPGRRYWSLINGYGLIWWDLFTTHSLNYSLPYLVEFVWAKHVAVSNITFLNAPAYYIHPVYCSDVHIQNVSITASPESPHTVGIVPDSSDNVCIEDCSISMGYDSISLKSGWDERAYLQSYSGAAVAFGSDMPGGISNVYVNRVSMYSSSSGYIEDITISDVDMDDVHMAFGAKGHFESHPDENFDPNALPVLRYITLQDVVGRSITVAGNFTGISESPFTSICLSNISLSINAGSLTSWIGSDVLGSSSSVLPKSCPELAGLSLNSSSACISSVTTIGNSAAL
ncbi:hypothetical protein ACJRO7_000447 [Eucalyptus globulus]|uniref:Glycoside hydrolase family 28 protein n=1 Tax=Eucalyptus globulus TaxID=34317 RepID=A0ABD3LTE5_EUCGL